MFPIKLDQENTNIFLVAFLSFLGCLQLLIVVVVVASLFPIPINPFVATLFKFHLREVRPEREMLYYRIFVVALIFCQTLAVWALRHRLKDRHLTEVLKPFIVVEMIWMSLQIFFVFKIIVDPNLSWLRTALFATLIASVITKIFWPEFFGLLRSSIDWLQTSTAHGLSAVGHVLMGGFIAILIYMPDVDDALAILFSSDQFYHLDSFFMAPTWAAFKGNILNINTTSEYSIFIPQLLSRWARFKGGFDYADAIYVMMFFAFTYLVLFYFFLRRWFGSVLIACFGTILVLKLHFFHLGVYPMIWRFPSATPMRFWFDIFVFLCLYQHVQTANRKWLAMAAIICGVAFAYLIDTGLYLTVAFYSYAFLTFAWPHCREIYWKQKGSVKTWLPLLLVFPPATAISILWFLQGPTIFSQIFWSNTFEFINLFVQGWGALPMHAGLRDRNFFAFVMGFGIPIVYVFSLVFVGALCFLNKIHPRNLAVIFMTTYGLFLYHYFIHRSADTSFYVVCFPFVFLVCFWLDKLLSVLKPMAREMIMAGLVVVVLLGLLTNRLLSFYPNILNKNASWNKERKVYEDQFDFEVDARLIQSLTRANEKVALVSSFEVKILMQADRAPFFYYFPLMESGSMNEPVIYSTYIHTHPRMKVIENQLKTSQPPFIFVEKKIYSGETSDYFMATQESLRDLMGFIRERYEVGGEGQYLIVLKRKT